MEKVDEKSHDLDKILKSSLKISTDISNHHIAKTAVQKYYQCQCALKQGLKLSNRLQSQSEKKRCEVRINDLSLVLSNFKHRVEKCTETTDLELLAHITDDLIEFFNKISHRIMTQEIFALLLKDSVNKELGIGMNDSFHIHDDDVPLNNFESGEEPQVTLKDEVDDHEQQDEIGENKHEQEHYHETNPEQDTELSRTEITAKELKALADEHRGVMSKGKTTVGNEVMDFDMKQKWSKKFLKQISEEFIIPKSVKRINFYSLNEDDCDIV